MPPHSLTTPSPTLVFNLTKIGYSETEINGIDALKMAKCYMDAFYQKPPSIPRNDIVAMEETLNPHLAFSEQIDNCLKGIDAIGNLHKSLFEKSGLTEWRQTRIQKLKEQYQTNIQTYVTLPNKETTLREWLKNMKFEEKKKIFLKWQNYNSEKLKEAFLKEFDKEFKEWRDNVFYKSLGKTDELKRMLISKFTKIGKIHTDLLDKIKKEMEDNKKEDDKKDAEKKENLIKSLYFSLNIKKFKKWRKLTKTNIEKIENIFLKNIDYDYNRWRKTLSTFSMPLRSAYLTFGGDLIRKLVIKISDEDLRTTLKGMLQRIKIEIESNFANVAYSFLRKKFDPKAFNEANKKLESSLESVNVNGELGIFGVYLLFKSGKIFIDLVLKVISVVRHGERLDNDNEEKKKALEREEQCYYSEDCNRKFGLDNSPLNKIGIKRAEILRKV
uniref:Uncharacterized protein n=1 Tax=Meloidogyne floridensis TaxID=298350 RepID=A0A915NH36_9BILA